MATAVVSEPPRPSVVMLPASSSPWKPATMAISPRRTAASSRPRSMERIRALAKALSVWTITWCPVKLRALFLDIERQEWGEELKAEKGGKDDERQRPNVALPALGTGAWHGLVRRHSLAGHRSRQTGGGRAAPIRRVWIATSTGLERSTSGLPAGRHPEIIGHHRRQAGRIEQSDAARWLDSGSARPPRDQPDGAPSTSRSSKKASLASRFSRPKLSITRPEAACRTRPAANSARLSRK